MLPRLRPPALALLFGLFALPVFSAEPASPCAAATLCVGPGGAYATIGAALAAAQPGDTIEIIAGTYRESLVLATPGLTLRGVGGAPHVTCAGLRPAANKACLLLAAADITLD